MGEVLNFKKGVTIIRLYTAVTDFNALQQERQEYGILTFNSLNEEWCLLGCYAVWLL
jgi:hypothetical protein